jgi:hypothetical protein
MIEFTEVYHTYYVYIITTSIERLLYRQIIFPYCSSMQII